MRGSIRRAKLLGKSRSHIRGGRSRVVVTMQVRLYLRMSPPHVPSPPSSPLPSPPIPNFSCESGNTVATTIN